MTRLDPFEAPLNGQNQSNGIKQPFVKFHLKPKLKIYCSFRVAIKKPIAFFSSELNRKSSHTKIARQNEPFENVKQLLQAADIKVKLAMLKVYLDN